MTESESEGMLETPGPGVTEDAQVDVVQSDSADMSNEELTAAASDDTPAAAAESLQPLTQDADNVEPGDSCQSLQPDEPEKDRTQLPVVKDVSDVPAVEIGDNTAEESSTVVVVKDGVADSTVSDVVSDRDAEHKLDDHLTSNVQSGQVDEAIVDNKEAKSSDAELGVCVDSSEGRSLADSAKNRQKIDWDALEKPKPKSSVAENAEFSQVFNKLVKQRADVENKDSPPVTTERTYSSLTELPVSEEPRSKFVVRHLSSKSSKVTSRKEQEAQQHKTLQLSSSNTDNPIDVDKSVISADRQTVSSRSALSSPGVSPAAQDSSVKCKSKPQAAEDDPEPTSPAKLKSQDSSGVKSSSSSGESSVVAAKVKLSSEVTRSSSTESPTTAKKKPESTSSPSKESAVVIKMKAHTEDKSLTSAAANIEDVRADAHSDKKTTSPAEPKKKGSFHMHVAIKGSSSNTSSPKAETCTTESPTSVSQSASSDDDKITMRSSCASVDKATSVKKHSEGKAEDQPATNPPVTDCSDQLLVPSVSSANTVDVGANDRPSEEKKTTDADKSEKKTTDADKSNSASVSQSKQEESSSGQDQNTVEPDPHSRTSADSYVPKSVPPQQKKVASHRSAAKVQPSEPETEEPAWIMAAKRKSDLWSENRAEEFDRKPQKAVADVGDQVCSYYVPESLLCKFYGSFSLFSEILKRHCVLSLSD